MKKVFLTMLVVCMAMHAAAVELPKQGFGLQVGWAQPILRLNSPTSKDTLSNTVKLKGFKIGVVYDASFAAGFGSSIGINYTFGASNGGWNKENASQILPYPQSRLFITYHQVELFVDWQYKFEVAKETYLMLYTGPTLQCGVGFTMRKDTRALDPSTLEEYVIPGDRYSAYNTDQQDQSLKRFNVTWGVGAGFQYKRYFLRGGYDFGLLNPYKNRDFENGNHTRGRLDQWNIKVGVYLWYQD